MTVVRAASEEWGVWKLDDRGLKTTRRKSSKDKASYESVAVERERGHMGRGQAAERISTLGKSRICQVWRNQPGQCWQARGMP